MNAHIKENTFGVLSAAGAAMVSGVVKFPPITITLTILTVLGYLAIWITIAIAVVMGRSVLGIVLALNEGRRRDVYVPQRTSSRPAERGTKPWLVFSRPG